MKMKKVLISVLSLGMCFGLMSMQITADWATIGDNRVYIEDNKMVKEWKKIGNDWYYFQKDNGYLTKGWLKTNGCWYYLDEKDGKMVTGWLAQNKSWFYLNPDNGIMYSNMWLSENGSRYYFLGNGQMATGRVVIDNQTYEFATDGKYIGTSSESLLNGLVTINGKLYYYKQNVAQTGYQEVNGKKLYFGADGAAVYGWYTMNGSTDYYVNGEVTAAAEDRTLRNQIIKALKKLSDADFSSSAADLQKAVDIRAFEGLTRQDSIRPNNTYFTTILDELKINYLDAKEVICFNVSNAEDVIAQLQENYIFMKALDDKAFTKGAIGLVQTEDTYQVHLLLLEK